MHTRKNWLNGLELRRAKAAPPQRIYNVILQCRVKLFEFAHNSISSTLVALAAALSLAVISVSAKVNL
jgi:hypothetical protein